MDVNMTDRSYFSANTGDTIYVTIRSVNPSGGASIAITDPTIVNVQQLTSGRAVNEHSFMARSLKSCSLTERFARCDRVFCKGEAPRARNR
jgi:hypothetical protein